MAQNPMTEQEFRRLRRFIRRFSAVNTLVYRLTGGRWMGSVQGRPIMLVTMKGARTGKQRTIPLMYVPYKEGVIMVGSQGGAPRSPVWVKNLQANPDVVVRALGRTMKLRARQADDGEKAQLWPICVQHYREYADYQARTDRSIPVFVCEPFEPKSQ
jgi:deazaflavin-dependent oxidoreductase (nitroreductase family)